MADIPKRPDNMPTRLLSLWQSDPAVRDYLDRYESKLDALALKSNDQIDNLAAAVMKSDARANELQSRIMAATRDWKTGACSATEAMARICSDRVVEKRDCIVPGCTWSAMPGRTHCGIHAEV